MHPEDLNTRKMTPFEHFEATLSHEQRQFLLKNPDVLNPELIGRLYQISLERMSMNSVQHEKKSDTAASGDNCGVTPKRPRKMVNSWMAFRSYYSPLIKDLPQKVRSPMLALLWKHDIDHGLWELLSAAYSYVRDNHSEDSVSIDQFLAIATQIVPVIPADQYFIRSGWARIGDVLSRVEASPKELPKATNVSCAGIVRYCFRQGLISKPPTTKQADLKPSQNLHRVPSSISFAAMASVPLAALANNPADQIISKEAGATDDIEFIGTEQADSLHALDSKAVDANLFVEKCADMAVSEMQVGSSLSNAATDRAEQDRSKIQEMAIDFDADAFLLNDFWSLAD